MDARPPTPPQQRGGLDLHELEVPEAAVLPFAVGSFQRVGPLSLADFPHRHTFYEIVLVTGGRGRHVVDSQPWPITPPHFGVIVPGQVHYWEGTQVEGLVVLFNEEFLVRHPEDVPLLRALHALAWLSPDPAEMASLVGLAVDMERELRAAESGFETVLRADLHILIIQASRIAGASAGAVRQTGELVDQFLRLIAMPGQGSRTLISYAREIGVSPGYLHELVREQTGLTPGRLTRRQRVLEAKRLLAGTGLTIRQVSDQAGFADPAYFCRFFRRETGLTPGEFRRRAAGMHHDPVV